MKVLRGHTHVRNYTDDTKQSGSRFKDLVE